MPIIKSAVKRMRQTATRRSRNVHTKRELRTAFKNLNAVLTEAISTGKTTGVNEALNEVYSKLDMAAKKNVIHKNTVARQKSRLAAKAKAAGIKPAAVKKAAPAKTTIKTEAKKKTTASTAKAAPKKPSTAKKATPKAKA